MKLLLDTHCFIWLTALPTRLSRKARAAMLDPTTEMYLSLASLWEMQIKIDKGLLTLNFPLQQALDNEMQHNGLNLLPIRCEHIAVLPKLPQVHRDPFDRMLVAQTLAEQMTLVSSDAILTQYPAPILW